MSSWTAGIDFGGTNVKVGLVSAAGRVRAVRVLAARGIGRPAAFLDAAAAAVAEAAREAGLRPSQLRGLGVGAPGPVDVERGVVYSMVNVPGWRNVPLARLLARRLGCRCVVDNDANVFTLAEARFGAGRGAQQLVGLTLGTGVGGGLLFDGALYHGADGAAGELGHMVIHSDGPRCGCGTRGCLEAYVGTAAILRLARDAARRSSGPLRALARQAKGRLTPALVSQAARAGDRAAVRVWTDVGTALGVGLANVVNLLNPDRIVIGGGVANAWPLLAPAVRRTVAANALAVPARRVRIVPARLGNHAGIVGAAVLVWSQS